MKAAIWGFLVLVLCGTPPLVSGDPLDGDPVDWVTLVSGPLRADRTCRGFRCVVVNGGESTVEGSVEFLDRRGEVRKRAVFEIGPDSVASVKNAIPQRFATRYCRVHVARDPSYQELAEGPPLVGSLEAYGCRGNRTLTTPLREVTPFSCDDEDVCTTDWFDPVAGECVHGDVFADHPDPCIEVVCRPVTEIRTEEYVVHIPVCESRTSGGAAFGADFQNSQTIPDLSESNVNILLSSALRVTDYLTGLRCDLVNSSDRAVFGKMKFLNQGGEVVRAKNFEMEAGKVCSLSTRSFRFRTGYCRAEVRQYPPDVSTGQPLEPTRIDVAGTLHRANRAGRPVTSTPLETISIGCDDGSACTLDSFDDVTGRCVHEPFCPADQVCHSVPETRTRTYTVQRAVSETRTICQP